MKLRFIGKFWFETHLKYLVTLMLSKLTLKKSKQTEKLKVINFFSVAYFGLLLPKTRLILAPIWPFLKNFWFRFRFLKDNSMMMINSTDFASNLQKNRKMWTISYLLRWINNYRVLLLVYLGLICWLGPLDGLKSHYQQHFFFISTWIKKPHVYMLPHRFFGRYLFLYKNLQF